MRKKIFNYIRRKYYSMLLFLRNEDYTAARFVYRELRSAVFSWVDIGLFNYDYYMRLFDYFDLIFDIYIDLPFKEEFFNSLIDRNCLRMRLSLI